MKKLLVYPFTPETVPLVRYREMLPAHSEVIPVVEKGATIVEGTDVSHLDGGTSCGITITSCFEEILAFVDDVMFTGAINSMEDFRRYFALAKEKGKNIFFCGNFHKSLNIDLESYQRLSYSDYNTDVSRDDKMHHIPVPIVLVTGMGQSCNKFDIQLGLRKKLHELEYKVSQVGTKEYSTLFGIHAVPQFPSIPLWRKVLLYNRYFKDIIDREDSEILVVGIPGGIMPIDDWHNELFGETAIAIAKSLAPDVSILSMYLGKVDNESLNDICNYTKYAMGAQLDYFHLSGTKLIFEHDMRTINYLTTDNTNVFDGQDAIDSRFFNVFSGDTSNAVYESVISQLQNNIEII